MHTRITRGARQVKALPKKGRLVKYLKDDEVSVYGDGVFLTKARATDTDAMCAKMHEMYTSK